MSEGETENLPIPVDSKTNLTVDKEPTAEETQREIIRVILERLKEPGAINLQYPNEYPFMVTRFNEDPDYQNGSQKRFVVLDRSPLMGTDQTCIAITDNKSRKNSQTQGSALVQAGKGLHSEKEVALTRFVQTPIEKLRNTGTYFLLVLSENVTNFTGRISKKGKAYPYKQHPPFAGKEGVPTFVEHWKMGNAQLAEIFVYDNAGSHLDFVQHDYQDILRALKTAKVNPEMTRKVAENEEKFQLARIAPNT